MLQVIQVCCVRYSFLSSSQLQEIYNSYFLNIENCFEGTHKLQESCIQSPTFHKLVARDFSEHYVASKNRSLIRRNHYWWGNAGNTINYRQCQNWITDLLSPLSFVDIGSTAAEVAKTRAREFWSCSEAGGFWFTSHQQPHRSCKFQITIFRFC